MNKFYLAGILAVLCCACYCPCKTAVRTPDSTQAIPPTIPQEQFSDELEIAPVSQSEEPPIAPVAGSKTSQSSPAPVTKQTKQNKIPLATAPATAQAIATPVAEVSTPTVEEEPLITPAPFHPTFKDEDIIDTTNRRLHPYAALVADSSAKQTAPWAYEQLKYGIYYSFIKAGTAYIHNLGLVNIDGHPAYVFQTTAFSASVIDAVFKVRDINQSWLDATDFYSYGYGQSVREGNYVRDEWLKFNYPEKKYEGTLQKKEEPHKISGPLDMKVMDMLTSLYFVRAHELHVGEDVVFDIVNREKQYPLIVKVLKKEKVKTAAGKFDCILVEPQFRGEGIFISKGKSLKVWLTDDKYKMPVKMKVEVFIGSVSAELLEYQRQAPANIL